MVNFNRASLPIEKPWRNNCTNYKIVLIAI